MLDGIELHSHSSQHVLASALGVTDHSSADTSLSVCFFVQGACGYGDLSDASAYPFFSAVGIPTSSDIMSFPTMGCGTCIEFECVNDRTPDYAVSLTFHAVYVLNQQLALSHFLLMQPSPNLSKHPKISFV